MPLLLFPLLLLCSSALAKEPSVNITVYYEALCPDSIRFVNRQLFPSWERFNNSLSVNFRPFGKANWTESGSSWNFTCQHGPDECYGNKVQACLLDQVPSPDAYVPMVDCLMRTHTQPDPAVGPCIGELGLQVVPKNITDCARGAQGSDLLHALGVETHSLKPPLYFIPWILFNNVYIEDDWNAALTDLTALLCNKYLAGHSKCKDLEYTGW